MLTWDIHFTIRHLNEEQWEKFLYRARGGNGEGSPIEAESGRLRVVGGKIHANDSTLHGSGQGAADILKEFVNCLDSSCKEVTIHIKSLSSAGFESLLKVIQMLNAGELVEVSCTEINYSEKGNEFRSLTLIVREEAIDNLPSLVKPLIPDLIKNGDIPAEIP